MGLPPPTQDARPLAAGPGPHNETMLSPGLGPAVQLLGVGPVLQLATPAPYGLPPIAHIAPLGPPVSGPLTQPSGPWPEVRARALKSITNGFS